MELQLDQEEMAKVGLYSRRSYLDYNKIKKANSVFVSNLKDIINKPENNQFFNEINNERDEIMR